MKGFGYPDSPPREEEWLRHQENFGEARLSAADGVVADKERVVVSDHPVRSNKGGFAPFFLMSRPPLLTRRGMFTFLFLIASLLVLCALLVSQPSQQVEWLYYGGDQAGTKYSSLADINASNVNRLHLAWQWKHWETPLQQYGTTPGFFEATPLMIDGVLYITTPYNSIAALDAESGKE